MSVLPEEYLAEVVEESEEPSRTYSIDFDNGRIVGFVDGIDAMKQSIIKALKTKRYACKIYDDQYGNDIFEVLNDPQCTEEFKEAAITGFIVDALSVDKRINSVDNIEISLDNDNAYISCTVETSFGTVKMEDVL